VAIAATSLTAHIASTTGREKESRQCSARFLPVTIPRRADNPWNSIAIRFASITTQSSA